MTNVDVKFDYNLKGLDDNKEPEGLQTRKFSGENNSFVYISGYYSPNDNNIYRINEKHL